VPADALTDLRADNNALSVWRVESDQSNLSPVILAVTSGRQRIDKLYYTLIDETILGPINIALISMEAKTPCMEANLLHCDLIELTARKVVTLAHEMMNFQRERITESKVKRLLKAALQDNRLDRAIIHTDLLAELESV
jgi:hypothetical protein